MRDAPPATIAGDFGVSLPVAGLMLYCQIVLAATYAPVPSGAIVIICGFCPVGTVTGAELRGDGPGPRRPDTRDKLARQLGRYAITITG